MQDIRGEVEVKKKKLWAIKSCRVSDLIGQQNWSIHLYNVYQICPVSFSLDEILLKDIKRGLSEKSCCNWIHAMMGGRRMHKT